MANSLPSESWKLSLGDQLSKARNRKDYTQKYVGSKLGVDGKTILRYEGGTPPPLGNLLALVRLLEADLVIGDVRVRFEAVAEEPRPTEEQLHFTFAADYPAVRLSLKAGPSHVVLTAEKIA